MLKLLTDIYLRLPSGTIFIPIYTELKPSPEIGLLMLPKTVRLQHFCVEDRLFRVRCRRSQRQTHAKTTSNWLLLVIRRLNQKIPLLENFSGMMENRGSILILISHLSITTILRIISPIRISKRNLTFNCWELQRYNVPKLLKEKLLYFRTV